MANSNQPMYIQKIQGWKTQINNATGTTALTLATGAAAGGGSGGSRVKALFATLTDTTTRDLQVSILSGGVTYILGVVNIPANSGTVGSGTNVAPAVNLLQSSQIPSIPLDENGNPYIDILAGDALQVAALTTLTSGKVMSVIAWGGGDF